MKMPPKVRAMLRQLGKDYNWIDQGGFIRNVRDGVQSCPLKLGLNTITNYSNFAGIMVDEFGLSYEVADKVEATIMQAADNKDHPYRKQLMKYLNVRES